MKSLSHVRLFATPWTVGSSVQKILQARILVGLHFLLQGIFLTQGSNSGLLHHRQVLYHLSHQGSPRPFRCDLNQIPNDYTVEMRNRFKELHLIDRVLMNYGWRFVTLYRRQGSRPSPRKRNAKKQNGCLRRPYK